MRIIKKKYKKILDDLNLDLKAFTVYLDKEMYKCVVKKKSTPTITYSNYIMK